MPTTLLGWALTLYILPAAALALFLAIAAAGAWATTHLLHWLGYYPHRYTLENFFGIEQ